MSINIERGVIRKVYRVKSKELGWCAVPFIDLDTGGLVTPVASFEQWPIPWIASFVGHKVEVVIDSNQKCFLLPFHNQHQHLLPPLVEHMSDTDPGSFQALPLLEASEDSSGKIADAVNPIVAVTKALDEVFKGQVEFPVTRPKSKAGFLSESGRKHLGFDEAGTKERYRKEVLAHREAVIQRRKQEKAQRALLLDALLESVLKKNFVTPAGLKVRRVVVEYLEDNPDIKIDRSGLIRMIRRLARKHADLNSNE